jgi:hypothetical protein
MNCPQERPPRHARSCVLWRRGRTRSRRIILRSERGPGDEPGLSFPLIGVYGVWYIRAEYNIIGREASSMENKINKIMRITAIPFRLVACSVLISTFFIPYHMKAIQFVLLVMGTVLYFMVWGFDKVEKAH